MYLQLDPSLFQALSRGLRMYVCVCFKADSGKRSLVGFLGFGNRNETSAKAKDLGRLFWVQSFYQKSARDLMKPHTAWLFVLRVNVTRILYWLITYTCLSQGLSSQIGASPSLLLRVCVCKCNTNHVGYKMSSRWFVYGSDLITLNGTVGCNKMRLSPQQLLYLGSLRLDGQAVVLWYCV